MADTKISNLTALTQENLAADDLMVVVDTSATETKKITIAELDERYQNLPVSFTPVFAAGTGTFKGNAGKWWRRRNFMCGKAYVKIVNAGTADLTMDIPESYTVDTNYIVNSTAAADNDTVGYGIWFDNGSQYRDAFPIYFSTTQIKFAYSGAALIGSVLATDDRIKVYFEVPIVGW